MEEDSSKREYQRVTKQFIARFRIKPDQTQGERESEWEVVTLHDLSAGGALFNLERELKTGLYLEIMINFPLSKNPIKCEGKILRVQKKEFSPIYQIAIAFLNLSSEDKVLIDNYTKRISNA